MGRRTFNNPPKTSASVWIVLAFLPFVLLGTCIAIIHNGPKGDPPRKRMMITITLPPHQINMPVREAKEIALAKHKETGDFVKVVTPAGQVIAEAP